MNVTSNLAQITRLTRKGRLAEALALIKKLAHVDATHSSPTVEVDPPDNPTAYPFSEANSSIASMMSRLHVVSRMKHFEGGLSDAPFAAPQTKPKSPSTSPDADRSQFVSRTSTGPHGTITYKLFIPGGSSARPRPLLVMLHGCTQSPDDFATGTRMNELAQEHDFIVAYPAQTSSKNPAKCWNWFNAKDQGRGQGEPALIAGLTHEIMASMPINPKRVYVAGLSAGGAAAAIMGAAYPDLYAAIGVHSGLACGAARDVGSAMAAMRSGGPAGLANAHPVPAIVLHGDQDKTVSYANSQQIIAQFKGTQTLHMSAQEDRSAGGVAYTKTIYSDQAGRSILEEWTLHGAGHAWSGGDAAGTYTDPRGPNASHEMVRFFLQHTR